MKQGILFDLDGTLWDSSEEVAISWSEALQKYSDIRMEITTEMIQNVMGKSMTEIADIFFEGYDLEKRRELLEYCCEEENNYILSHGGKLLEGLEETLKTLQQQGYFLYIVSNCQVGYIEAFLEYHKLGQYFDDYLSFGETGREKGYNIRLAVERNQLEQAFYVGDTQGDYLAATKAEIPFVHAKTGYGVVEAQVPYIEQLSELPEVAKKMFDEMKHMPAT